MLGKKYLAQQNKNISFQRETEGDDKMEIHSSRTTEHILQEIRTYFGCIPPFFAPVLAIPTLLEHFWHQTQIAYIHNPLPPLFKEKLFCYLSHIRDIPYDLRYHGVSLHALGLKAHEIVALLKMPLPLRQESQQLLATLKEASILSSWPETGSELEHTLFLCSALLFLQPEHVQQHRRELQRLLGSYYAYLITLHTYIKACHDWIDAALEEGFPIEEAILAQFHALTETEPELLLLFQRHQTEAAVRRWQTEEHLHADVELERRTRRSLEALLAVAEILMFSAERLHTGDLEETAWSASATVKRLIELVRSIMGCERIGILSFDAQSETLQPVALVGFLPDQEKRWWQNVPGTHLSDQLIDPSLVQRIQQGEVLILDRRKPPFTQQDDPYGVYSWLVAPMFIGSEFAGLLSLDYGQIEHIYTEDEKKIASAIGRLIALVLERDRLLLEKTETQAHEIALLDANRRMNEFLSIAGHELKTPITSIKGNVQFMRRRLKKELQADYAIPHELLRSFEEFLDLLMRAEHQTNRLALLVNDIMDVSRIQSKKLHLHKELADITDIIRTAIRQQQQFHPERLITAFMPDKPVLLMVDVDRIEQVVINYLSNALKYSDTQEPVEVTLEVREQEHLVRLSVSDKGIGLSPKDQEHVWDRFYRVEGSQVRSGSHIGLGLGLYICRSIIEQHGGEVGISSTPDIGSTFWFSLHLP